MVHTVIENKTGLWHDKSPRIEYDVASPWEHNVNHSEEHELWGMHEGVKEEKKANLETYLSGFSTEELEKELERRRIKR